MSTLRTIAVIFSLFVIFFIFTSSAYSTSGGPILQPPKTTPAQPGPKLCCPEGFSDSFWDCPAFTDTAKQCCREPALLTFDVVNKVAPDSAGLTGNYCCPLGYGNGILNCPSGVYGLDETKQCCKSGGLFGTPDIKAKILCTIPPAPSCQTTGTPPPAPCASNIVNGSCTKISTGLGDIGTTPTGLIQSVFRIVLSLSGGIALLLIIFSGYRLLASQGNPEAVKGAREQLTAAIVGLLFIILALVILQIIGVDVLHIPGFTQTQFAPPSRIGGP